MDRLTERKAGITGLSACFEKCDHANNGCDCVRIRSALRRLSNYEDTGLTPEEITAAEIDEIVYCANRFGEIGNSGAKDILLRVAADEHKIASGELKPVVHAHWIFGSTQGHSWMKCSKCLVSQSGQTSTFTFCPNCGALMNENVKEENTGDKGRTFSGS